MNLKRTISNITVSLIQYQTQNLSSKQSRNVIQRGYLKVADITWLNICNVSVPKIIYNFCKVDILCKCPCNVLTYSWLRVETGGHSLESPFMKDLWIDITWSVAYSKKTLISKSWMLLFEIWILYVKYALNKFQWMNEPELWCWYITPVHWSAQIWATSANSSSHLTIKIKKTCNATI